MFEVTARVAVREGELDGFKRQAAEMIRQTKEKDTKTLRYDWFLSDDGTECEVREGYMDADAFLELPHEVTPRRSQRPVFALVDRTADVPVPGLEDAHEQ